MIAERCLGSAMLLVMLGGCVVEQEGPDPLGRLDEMTADPEWEDPLVTPGSSWYVSPSGRDEMGYGSLSQPFRTIQYAVNRAVAGDTVFIMAGTYHNPGFGSGSVNNGPAVTLSRSGRPGAWILIRNLTGHRPRIHYDGRAGIQGQGISYVKIMGLEIEGPAASITSADAWAHRTDNPRPSRYNNEGIVFWTGGAINHHIIISGNHVHHACGTGITVQNGDVITIANNRVHDNSHWASDGPSGINVFRPASGGGATVVKSNVVYRNWSEVAAYFENEAWFGTTGAEPGGYGTRECTTIHDGQGIVVSQGNVTGSTGQAIIENNLCVQNGMAGIAFHDHHNGVIRNNTLYSNGYSGGSWNKGLILQNASNVDVFNNIVVIPYINGMGNWVQLFGHNSAYRFYNNCYSGTGGYTNALGTNAIRSDPQFVSAGTAPATWNFHLARSSPCVDKGASSGAPGVDLFGTSRRMGQGVDIGAIESH